MVKVRKTLSLELLPTPKQERIFMRALTEITKLYNTDIIYRSNLLEKNLDQPDASTRYIELVKGNQYPGIYTKELGNILNTVESLFQSLQKLKKHQTVVTPELCKLLDYMEYYVVTSRICRINNKWRLRLFQCGEVTIKNNLDDVLLGGKIVKITLLYSPQCQYKWIADVTLEHILNNEGEPEWELININTQRGTSN